MKLRLTALGSVLIIVALAACGGGHGGSTLPTTNSGAAYNGATTFDWGKEQLDGAVYSGPVKLAHMQVAVVVKQQNLAGLISYAQQVSDPRSPMFRMFLTPQEIAARFGASQSDYQAAANYFVGKGLSVSGWPQRLALSVAGSQAAMEKAFGTTFGTYSKDGFNFVGPVGTPHFASAVPITAVSNLVAMHTMHTYVIPAPPRANGNSSSGYSPQQIRNAFDFTGAYNAGYTGSGITIGIIGTGPINVTRPASGNPACGADADLAALKSVYGVSAVGTECERDVTTSGVSAGLSASGIPTASPTWSPVPNGTPSPNPGQSPRPMFPYSGDFQSPPPVASSSCSTSTALPACNPEDLEAQLDTQQTAMLAPGSTVDFYLGYNASDCLVYFPDRCASSGSNSGTAYIGIVEADPEIQQLIAENVADTVSISYGNGETQNVGSGFDAAGVGYQTAEYAEMAAEGIAVFASSGDSGVAECLGGVNGYLSQTCVSHPSGDPNVTSVGGVNAPIDEFGQLVTNMTAWGVTNGGNGGTIPKNASGSGGGTSTIFAAPRLAANGNRRDDARAARCLDAGRSCHRRHGG